MTTSGSSLEHAIGLDGLLVVRLRDGEVRLHAGDGETVHVRDVNGHDLNDMFAIEAAAGSLSLSAGRGLEIVIGPRSVRRGTGQHSPELEMEIPRGATVVLEATSGEVGADGLVGDQRYRTASGDVGLRAVSGKVTVEVVSGDVGIDAIGEANVSVRSVSGDVGIRAETLSSLRITTTSGDIGVAGRLAGPGPFAIETVSGDGLLAPAGDVRIEMTSLTGDLASELEGRQVTERGRRSLTVGTTGPLVTFRSMSGDLGVVRALRGRASEPAQTPEPTEPPEPAAPPVNPEPAVPLVDPEPAAGPATAHGAIAAAYEAARLRILRSLERGEIDVVEAGRRLETLDAGVATVPSRDGELEGPAAGTDRAAQAGPPTAAEEQQSNG